MVRASRVEGVKLRPFTGLDSLEAYLEDEVQLVFSSNAGTKELLSLEKGLVPPKYIPTLGLVLRFPKGDLGDLQKHAKSILGDDKFASWAVKVSDRSTGVLRESSIIASGQVKDLGTELVINTIGEVSECSIFQNRFTGYRIEFFVFLNQDKESNSVSPKRKGTILGSASFEIIPVTDFDAIQPLELTDDIRQKHSLSPQAWFFVAFEGEILETETFEDSLSFYVDPKALSAIKVLPDPYKVVGEAVLATSLISQIVFEISNQLQKQDEDWVWDGVTGVMLRFLFTSFGDVTNPAEFLELLKEKPSKITAALAARADLGSRLTETFEKISEGALNVSNDYN